MHALPFVFSLVAAVLLTPRLLRRLADSGATRENYRGRALPFPIGIVLVPAALLALIPSALLVEFGDLDVLPRGIAAVLVLVPAVALIGFIDDVLSGPSRGWRGHGADVVSGGFSTGALKAVGTLGVALFVALDLSDTGPQFLLAAAVLVLATNTFNLLDLRPGRSVKAFLLLGVGLTAATQNVDVPAALGIFIAPILVVGWFDLRERGMLGDAGSNAVGAVAGLWIVLTLNSDEQLVVLVLLLALNVFGEFRSISSAIEKIPGLKHLDSLGRPK